MSDWIDTEMLINIRKERDTLRKQLDEWKEAHDNLARQLSVTNDLLEIAVKELIRVPHNVNHQKHGECLGCNADKALAEINQIGGMNVQG